jgi:hypothetical protein
MDSTDCRVVGLIDDTWVRLSQIVADPAIDHEYLLRLKYFALYGVPPLSNLLNVADISDCAIFCSGVHTFHS